ILIEPPNKTSKVEAIKKDVNDALIDTAKATDNDLKDALETLAATLAAEADHIKTLSGQLQANAPKLVAAHNIAVDIFHDLNAAVTKPDYVRVTQDKGRNIFDEPTRYVFEIGGLLIEQEKVTPELKQRFELIRKERLKTSHGIQPDNYYYK